MRKTTLFLFTLCATSAYASLVNPGFETGDLTSWTTSGTVTNVQVLGALGTITAPEGAYMALVSNGPGERNLPDPDTGIYIVLDQAGLVSEQFLVTPGLWLRFTLAFLTAEPNDGTAYPDWYEVRAAGVTLASGVVNTSLLALPGQPLVAPDGTALVNWSGFSTQTISLAALEGQTVALEFLVTDAVDNSFDSAVLLDNVTLTDDPGGPVSDVPEPSSLLLCATAGALAWLCRRRAALPVLALALALCGSAGAQTLCGVPRLRFDRNYFINGDYAAAGVGLHRQTYNWPPTTTPSVGMINISGVPDGAEILAAFLYWQSSEYGSSTDLATGSFRGTTITGTNVGEDNYWSKGWYGTQAKSFYYKFVTYRADVLSLLPMDSATGQRVVNGPHNVSFMDTDWDDVFPITFGASLVVVYRKAGLPFKAVVIYQGNYYNNPQCLPFDLSLRGFYQAAPGEKKLTLITGEGEGSVMGMDNILFNGYQLGGQYPANLLRAAAGPEWNTVTVDVGGLVAPDSAEVTIVSDQSVPKCYSPDGINLRCWMYDAGFWAAIIFSTPVKDTDGDGLLDIWETSGFTDMDGVRVDLPLMGADPTKPDVFVEIDWMTAADHSHKPKPEAIAKVVDAFAKAPWVPIRLHVDMGQGYPFNGGNAITESISTTWKSDFEAIRAASFSKHRRHFFHYSLWGHQITGKGYSGIADLPGGDFMVTLGTFTSSNPSDNQVGSVEQQAGTFMHELGHNLGLKHAGGAHDPHCKPNFQSIMNYMFQLTGLQAADGSIVFDYSRQVLPTLDEGSLNETTGMGATQYRPRWYGPPNTIDWLLGRTTNYTCDKLTPVSTQMVQVDGPGLSGPLNWNNDLTLLGAANYNSSPVSVDLGFNGFIDSAAAGWNDWMTVNTNLQMVSIRGDSSRATAMDIDVRSAYITPPPSPMKLTARLGTGVVRLAWNPVLHSMAREYRIYRFEGANVSQTTSIGQTQAPVWSRPAALFTDSNVRSGTSYGYFVTAVSEFGVQSGPSNILVVRVP